ncbi:MAG TPA: cytochrome c peroxidase, partial [Chitinophagaceae bacterium]|nr:cytochrome c peroxidase [Chitinophagaceae bacterium]
SIFIFIISLSFNFRSYTPTPYETLYQQTIADLADDQHELAESIKQANFSQPQIHSLYAEQINKSRRKLKAADFWLRYLDPILYKKINGPLPVEWETEVFEKFEAPYRREGAGLSLAYAYLEEKDFSKDSLFNLINNSLHSTKGYLDDSIKRNLKNFDHFFLCNRLFLLNLGAIYTTGFECPDSSLVIPELAEMLGDVKKIYTAYNVSYPSTALTIEYLTLFDKAITFVKQQPVTFSTFDHFRFIQQFVNPLYRLNQQMLINFKVRSKSFVDYSLNKYALSIFDKSLFRGQNYKGVYLSISDSSALKELTETGRLLFYDPLLSGNNKRSCASCHKPSEFFTDTTVRTNQEFDQQKNLERHTPSLLNTMHQHLLMHDGKHYTIENQIKDVITNPVEMAGTEKEVLKKIVSCNEYKKVFKKYLPETPAYTSITLDHVASAIMLYLNEFSHYYAPFDRAMTENKELNSKAISGFNLFMSKAKCGTCHFVPHFNGVKPPYTNSEFEVLGVPANKNFAQKSPDPGRFRINPVEEMSHAFRTNTIRNTHFTKPYMHNGVFNSLEEVIDFYDAGGGIGKGITVKNQTLPQDPLKLSPTEKEDLLSFIASLNEEIPAQYPPASLPLSALKEYNKRKAGGDY